MMLLLWYEDDRDESERCFLFLFRFECAFDTEEQDDDEEDIERDFCLLAVHAGLLLELLFLLFALLLLVLFIPLLLATNVFLSKELDCFNNWSR